MDRALNRADACSIQYRSDRDVLLFMALIFDRVSVSRIANCSVDSWLARAFRMGLDGSRGTVLRPAWESLVA